MGGCTRSSPGNSGQMLAEQISPLPLGRCGTRAAGLALRGGPDAASPLALKAAIDITADHLPAGLRTGERLHPDDIGVPRVGGKNLRPGTFARNPRPPDPDALHLCHLLGRSLRGRADGSLLVFGTGSSGTVRARARDRRHPKVPTWVEILRG